MKREKDNERKREQNKFKERRREIMIEKLIK